MHTALTSLGEDASRRLGCRVLSRLIGAAVLGLMASGLMLVGPATAGSTVITTRASDTTPAYGEAVQIKGRVTGRMPGSRVHLTLISHGGTGPRVATTTLGRYGRYLFTWQPPLTETSQQHTMQVVVPKTRRKSKAFGSYFWIVPDAAPFDPQTLRPKYLQTINAARANSGLSPLTMVEEYTEIANGIAVEIYDNGGAFPENVSGSFPSNLTGLGRCYGSGIGRSGGFGVQEWDLDPDADYLTVGIHQQPDGSATVVMYVFAERPSDG